MRYSLLLLFTITFSFQVSAQDSGIKDSLKYSLWSQGISQVKQVPQSPKKQDKKLPEEIQRILSKHKL
ncbi:MAG: hypothetical protein K2P81_15960 [Bacteriovoracaceae bacterium]|nr:hypothetical protein [Bacteriovoracaceae bacterium]